MDKINPRLWVQLSPEFRAAADKAFKEHMAKPVEQRMKEYGESILRGYKMLCEAIEYVYGQPAVDEVNKILNQK